MNRELIVADLFNIFVRNVLDLQLPICITVYWPEIKDFFNSTFLLLSLVLLRVRLVVHGQLKVLLRKRSIKSNC